MSQDPESGFLEQLGQRVRTTRSLRGMSRKVLAKVSGISERYIAQLEGGKGNVSIVLLRRRLGRLGGREIAGLIGNAGACSLAALLVAELVHVFLGSHAHQSFLASALVLILQGVLGGGAFLLFATVLRVPEVNQVIGMVRRKLGR